jgi:hypothetical protein
MSEALNKDDKEFNRDQLAKEAYLASGIEVEEEEYTEQKSKYNYEERHARCWAPGPDEC